MNPRTKFLVVDDVASIRRLIISSLRQLHFQGPFYEASDGQKAIDLLEELHEVGNRVDFILSDWDMPNVSGFDFLKYVRSSPHFQSIPFVMITTQSDRDKILRAVQLGVSNYLLKPWSVKTFQEKIFKAWESHNQ